MANPKLVRIEWHDATQSEPGWQAVEDIKYEKGVRVITTGWLVKETPDVVVLANSLNMETGDVEGVSCIPQGCITKVENWK